MLPNKPPITIPANETEQVACPVCGNNASQNYLNISPLALRKCYSCEIVYTSPRVKEDQIGKYYGAIHHELYNIPTDESLHDPFYNRIIDTIQALNPQSKTLLDIGAGGGRFAHCAKQKGLEITVQDISQENIDNIQKRYGINGTNACIDKIQGQEQYDSLSLLHVLEHVYDPKSFLKTCRELLKPSGVIAVLLPNLFSIDCTANSKLRSNVISFPYHNFFFTPATFEDLATQCGFKIVGTEHDYARHISRLRKVLGLKTTQAEKNKMLKPAFFLSEQLGFYLQKS